MTTNLVLHLKVCLAEAERIAAQGEIIGTPDNDEARAIEAENFLDKLRQIAGCFDQALAGMIRDADDHIGAMTDGERRGCFKIVSEAIEGNHDYPFERFARSVWEAGRKAA